MWISSTHCFCTTGQRSSTMCAPSTKHLPNQVNACTFKCSTQRTSCRNTFSKMMTPFHSSSETALSAATVGSCLEPTRGPPSQRTGHGFTTTPTSTRVTSAPSFSNASKGAASHSPSIVSRCDGISTTYRLYI